MALDHANSLVVFVPGIMGSVLRYHGPDKYGVATEEVLWGTDGMQNLDILGRMPERLRAGTVYADSVIGSVTTPPTGRTKDVYGSLIKFCVSSEGLGLREGQNFCAFPYDWRQDNIISAGALAEHIRKLDPGNGKNLYLIAHSMGGLVCRIMLNTDRKIAAQTRLLFQIASPLEGSPKAYWTLNKFPTISPLIDAYYLAKHYVDPGRRAELMQTVQSFTSAFQLLPPHHINVLVGPGATEYPAVHPQAWSNQLHGQLARAAAMQPLLELPEGIETRCVFSKGHKTFLRFAVDQFWAIAAHKKTTAGDATVTAVSAQARSPVPGHCYIQTGPTEHTALCANPEVHRLMKAAIL